MMPRRTATRLSRFRALHQCVTPKTTNGTMPTMPTAMCRKSIQNVKAVV